MFVFSFELWLLDLDHKMIQSSRPFIINLWTVASQLWLKSAFITIKKMRSSSMWMLLPFPLVASGAHFQLVSRVRIQHLLVSKQKNVSQKKDTKSVDFGYDKPTLVNPYNTLITKDTSYGPTFVDQLFLVTSLSVFSSLPPRCWSQTSVRDPIGDKATSRPQVSPKRNTKHRWSLWWWWWWWWWWLDYSVIMVAVRMEEGCVSPNFVWPWWLCMPR